jgi:phenylpyruvate tautomerase PptA (4-oxalocrotonate tautomerase family)
MPLIRIDVVADRRSTAELGELLDTIHGVMVAAFEVPPRDRYQILQQHPREHLVVEDTGLGIERSDDIVVLSVTSRPRTSAQKVAFYGGLATQLQQRCRLKPSDLVVSITENSDTDWSFGHGRAQFVTGEL